MLSGFIGRTKGDPVELQKIYEENFSALAGQPGRGEDWGIPLVVLQHICAVSHDALYIIDFFKDDETRENLLNTPSELPEHLRPSVSRTAGMWQRMGVANLRDRPEDTTRLKVIKMLPSLNVTLPELGAERRLRS
jgi:hypothetical protein